MKIIGLLESPNPRKIELMMLYAVMKGIPIKQIRRYAMVPETASAGTDMTRVIGLTRNSSPTVNTTETDRKSVMVLPIAREACFLLPAPTACPIITVPPIARPTIITVSICITWLPIETAVVLSTPLNCPIMNRSAIPYSVCKK